VRVTRQASRQTQEVCCRVLLDTGEIEKIRRIERDTDGLLYVRTALGRRHSAERIIIIINPERGQS
jgi:DNA-binding IclR family transcriptional regulator